MLRAVNQGSEAGPFGPQLYAVWCPACRDRSGSVRSRRPPFRRQRRGVRAGTRPVDLIGKVQALQHVAMNIIPQASGNSFFAIPKPLPDLVNTWFVRGSNALETIDPVNPQRVLR